MSRRLLVKFMAKGQRDAEPAHWLRQFPGGSPSWGDCEFLLDPDARRYDWLVVYDDLAPVGDERFSSRIERLPCPRANSLLVTAEPSAVKVYGKAFTRQFGWVLTSQEPWALPHPQAVRSQTGYRWFYGIGSEHLRAYDELAAAPPPHKEGAISTVCSNKRDGHTLHRRRFDFTQALAERLPELDRFGRGIAPIDDKADAIDGYRLHLVIENHVAPHHFTEKLADAFLGRALPVYHGAPNLADYFPEDSFVPLAIDDPVAAARSIRAVLAEGLSERRRSAIETARRLVLERYNLFATLADFVTKHHADQPDEPNAVIKGRHRARIASPATLIGDLLEKRRVRRRLARMR